jgi:hypothetical protein
MARWLRQLPDEPMPVASEIEAAADVAKALWERSPQLL